MKKLIIFDLNRTLYDPDLDVLFPGAFELLDAVTSRGFSCALVSRKEPGREDILKRFDIEKFFGNISFVPQKTEQVFKDIAQQQGADPKYTYVIGDYLHEEIRLGNRLGMRTIWLKQGRFAYLAPESAHDVPWKTISELKELSKIIR